MIIKTLTEQGDGYFLDIICDICDSQIRLYGGPLPGKLDYKPLKKFNDTWSVEMKELAVIHNVEDMLTKLEFLIISIYSYSIATWRYNLEEAVLKEGGIVINDKHVCKSCWGKYEGSYVEKARKVIKDIGQRL